MIVDVAELIELLNEILPGSRGFINARATNGGAYAGHIWMVRGVNKTKARNSLIPISSLDTKRWGRLLEHMEGVGAIAQLLVIDADYSEKHLFLTPLGVELLNSIDVLKDEMLTVERLGCLVREARDLLCTSLLQEAFSRLQDPLSDNESMGARSAVFCWFLILNGAISRDRAFVLEKRESDKEFVLQKEIVDYLNGVSSAIYATSFDPNKKGKVFKSGDFDDFLRRSNKDIRDTLGTLFQSVDKKYLYMDVCNEDGEIRLEDLKRVIGITLRRLKAKVEEGDNLFNAVDTLARQYWVNRPMKQSHSSFLFLGDPPGNYYSVLGHIISEELEQLESEDAN